MDREENLLNLASAVRAYNKALALEKVAEEAKAEARATVLEFMKVLSETAIEVSGYKVSITVQDNRRVDLKTAEMCLSPELLQQIIKTTSTVMVRIMPVRSS